MVRLVHVWSSDLGLVLSLPFMRPFLARGWEVYAICPPGPRIPEIEREGITWLPHRLERRIDPANDLLGAVQLFGRLRALRPDIVHSHNAKVGLVARTAAALARVPVVIHTHHGLTFSLETRPVLRRSIAALERAANLGLDRLFVQSEEDRRILLAMGAIDAARLECLGNGIELERFDPTRVDGSATRRALGLAPSDVLFLSAGRLVAEKGFVELFEAAAAARARDPRIRLVVAGPVDSERTGALPAAVVAQARANGVLILGERADMPALYAAADVVVLASWREGLPRVLMEGAAMARPLLATAARGCTEIVRSGLGVVVPVRDARALAEAMLALAADPARRAAMGAAARADALVRFDLGRVVARVAEVYDELLNRRG